MFIKENEKEYYDDVVRLYSKYGEDIPDAELMRLNITEKKFGISFQRSQEIFDFVQNEAETKNNAADISPIAENQVVEQISEPVETSEETIDSESNEKIAASMPPQIQHMSIVNESKMEVTERHTSSVISNTSVDAAVQTQPQVENKPTEVKTKPEDCTLVNNEIPIQQVQSVKAEVPTANILDNNIDPVEDPGDINKWKVIFWYTIGFFTILFWGIGLIIMIWETIVVFRHKNKQVRYAKYLIQQGKTQQ